MHNDDHKEDIQPPYSKLFIVCSKHLSEDDLRPHFENFGSIENLYILRDRQTSESRGVAYVKYSKTSHAAAAIQHLHMKKLRTGDKPLKVMVANKKHDTQIMDEQKLKRLFVKVSKIVTESELLEHFSKFGAVTKVTLQKDKMTDTCKGFAYIQYASFLDTALAYEQCDTKYKPMFAAPKPDLKRNRNIWEDNFNGNNSKNVFSYEADNIPSHMPGDPYIMTNTVIVKCTPLVSIKYLERLFNIIPGITSFNYTPDAYNGLCKAVVNYSDKGSAALAIERINNFEFPSGEIVSVKPYVDPISKAANDLKDIVGNFKNSLEAGAPNIGELVAAIEQASTVIKAATAKTNAEPDRLCGLPSLQPLAPSHSKVAQRCFIVCKPFPPPIKVLQDIFCRFGELIDVSLCPNKNFGFVRYASVKSAQDAIQCVNGMTVHGSVLVVANAEEKQPKKEENTRDHDVTDIHLHRGLEHDTESKRMKYIDP